jgi:hypothetical protein
MTKWTLLIVSLPTRRRTVRMRLWRRLSAVGAAALRDGVYLLPATPAAKRVFEEQANAVRDAGGMARIVALAEPDDRQQREFSALFDRGTEYTGLLEAIQAQRDQIRRRRVSNAARRVQAFRRRYDALRAMDFFPGPAAAQVQAALQELDSEVRARDAAGEPRSLGGKIEKRNASQFRGRTWATRARPWIDRMASAWLIKRFIDPKAKILWLKDIKRCPKSALGFDFDGATFSHVGARVTFEHLLASFGLEQDAALVQIGRIVHYLDVGGVPIPEAQGLSAILAGARALQSNDNKLLAEASRVFDHLYHSCQKE